MEFHVVFSIKIEIVVGKKIYMLKMFHIAQLCKGRESPKLYKDSSYSLQNAPVKNILSFIYSLIILRYSVVRCSYISAFLWGCIKGTRVI